VAFPINKDFKKSCLFEVQLTSLKDHGSRETIDTDCTSSSPDHSDKHSLKSIDEALESIEGEHPECHFQKIDLLPQEFSPPLLERVKKGWRRSEATLITHFRQTIKIDKYLRLLSSIIKTRRAYAPNTRLLGLYKELILARRVIRWESKYDTLIGLMQKEEGVGMKFFKIMQLTGDFVDLSSFWLRVIHKGTDNRIALIEQLEQTESNFYFTECCIWFIVYTYRYFALRTAGRKEEEDEEERKAKMVENSLKAVKYLMDILTSYNNSSLRRVGGEINHKLAGYLTFLSSVIGIFLLCR
jgi:hypothetical protein